MGLGHTGQLLYPVRADAPRDVLEVDVPSEERGVDRAEVERPSRLELGIPGCVHNVRVIGEARELEGHERLVEPAAVGERLPEGGCSG